MAAIMATQNKNWENNSVGDGGLAATTDGQAEGVHQGAVLQEQTSQHNEEQHHQLRQHRRFAQPEERHVHGDGQGYTHG